jgi:hypothetical protein
LSTPWTWSDIRNWRWADAAILFRLPRKPWNAGGLVGQKSPLETTHVWAIRQQLVAAGTDT